MAAPPTLPTNHVDNVGERISASIINDLAQAGNHAFSGYNVRAAPYSAVANGIADDTTPVQTAMSDAMLSTLKGGSVHLTQGSYKLTSSLVFGRADHAQHYVNLVGDGITSTALNWAGSNSLTAIKTWQNKNTFISGFYLNNLNATPFNNTTRGTSTGFYLGNYTSGLGTNGQIISNVYIANFHWGWQIGGINDGVGTSLESAGDMIFLNCHAENCDRGFYLTSSNTLDVHWVEIEISFNGDGVYSDVGGSFNVLGGGCSFNGSDFQFLGGGNFSLKGVRSESVGYLNTSGRFAKIGSTSAFSGVDIDSCQVAATDPGTPGHDGIMIDIGSGANVSIRQNSLRGGGIRVSTNFAPATNSVTIMGNLINDIAHPGAPFLNFGSTRDLLSYFSFGNVRFLSGNGDYRPFPNEMGTLVGGVLTPLFRQNGRGATATERFRRLMGISGTSTVANNLRGTATLVAGTVNVVFGTAEVQSLVATGATSGTFTLNFNGYDTSVLNWNASIGQIQAALVALWNIGAGGVVVTGGPMPGTAVTITFAGSLVGGGPQNLITVTNNTVVGGTPTVTRTTAGTGNPPEPDASYTITANSAGAEAVGISAKATTGFTLTVPGGASTNAVDWQLIR